MDTELVTDPDACLTYIVSPSLVGLGGGILWRPPAYSLLRPCQGGYVFAIVCLSVSGITLKLVDKSG